MSYRQEFMIGKTAAHYVRPYHSLYHYKYWLRQRCDTKVSVKDGLSLCILVGIRRELKFCFCLLVWWK